MSTTNDSPHILDASVAGELQQIADGVHLLPGFGNCTIIVGADGAAVIDPGLFINGPRVVAAVHELTDAPVRHVIYTHGHFDHAFGTPAILEDAAARGHAPPVIVAHSNVAKRFDRYHKTAGHLAETFSMQFASWSRSGLLGGTKGGDVMRNAVYCRPTLEYEDRLAVSLGDLTLQCRHGLGETDDHTWIWVPERRTIVGGDFIVSSMPNAGTPFRVQRYVLEWAETLEEMAGLEPDAVVSGHGGVFRDDVALQMLLTTARALRYLEDEVVRRLNAGQWGEEILHNVTLPEELASSPYLQPLYGCTAFAVRSIIRRYTGWYDGNPTMLFPSTRGAVAEEVVALAGGADAILNRARTLRRSGDVDDVQRALHLVDYVIFFGAASVDEARELKAQLLRERAQGEPSFVARNILQSAAIIEEEQTRESS